MAATIKKRNEKLECGYCHELIDEDEYRNHVINCNKSDEEDEDQPVSKVCSLCRKQVKDLTQHRKTCPGRDDETNHKCNNRHSSPSSSAQKQSNNNISSPTNRKKCPTCSVTFDDDEFQEHVKSCDGRSSRKSTNAKKTKTCPTCSETVDADDFQDHIDRCDVRSSRKPTNAKKTKTCPTCSETVDADDFQDHIDRCDVRSSRKPTNAKKTKTCPTCSETVDADDFQDHIDRCDVRSSRRPTNAKKTKTCPTCSETVDADDFQDHMDHCDVRSSRKSTNAKKKTKTCPTCSETVDADDFQDHIDRCDVRSSRKSTNARRTKTCPTCSETVDADDFQDHIDRCDVRSSRKSTNAKKKTKTCPTCSETVDADDFQDHMDHCDVRSSRKSTNTKKTKTCPTCSETVDADDFQDHIDRCDVRSSRKSTNGKKKTKTCPTCSETIDADDFPNHTYSCSNRSSREKTNPKTTQECPVCLKEIPIADSQKHVNECLEKISGSTKSTRAQQSCFTCSSPVDSSKNSSHTMPCRNKHVYCLKCLQNSMNEFIRSNTAPVCHSTVCTYELSRYDVECLPLQADMMTHLLALVKSTQRPQCPSCFFYVEFKTMADLQRHAISCNLEDMMSCNYCHCLFNKHRLNDHSQQCQNDSPIQQRQALINFLLPRTKYALTPPQIHVFLEVRRKSRLPLDARSIVDALAELEGAFPFDVPTRDCDICMNSHIYDDIFVFGCEESHKVCYECFAESCTTKMNSKEVLKCALCAYQLQEGEIKQLRIPADQKRQFVDYQLQKTFGGYASGQGIIRCPNKQCKWVAEARDPNERFQVECPLCHHQFCSLCNAQYHFRTTCQELPELNQRWFFWCNTERGNYWQARAQQDANFQAQLEDYERQKAANAQRNEELRQRYNELLIDEGYKAQNCRLCPHCGRVVQHLAGCDAMVCGRNYHGGDVQSGCGKNFRWSQATPYVPIANGGPQQVTNNIAAPEQQKAVIHEGVRCDACGNDVQGIRFDCIHCPSLTFCERCEQRSTLEHSNQIRDQNKQQHVFQLITAPLKPTSRR